MPLKLPDGNVSVLQAITVTTGVPVVLVSLVREPSLTVKVVDVGVDAMVLTPLQLSNTPPVNPEMFTWAPDCKLCGALEVYVATPLVRTQLAKVMLLAPSVEAPVVVWPTELAAVRPPWRSSAITWYEQVAVPLSRYV